MRTHLEFRSADLLDGRAEEGAPRGARVARLIADQLPSHGYRVGDVHPEDWGWRVELAHAAFPLWIGCGHYQEYPDGHLCFIEPSAPSIRRWLRRVDTPDAVEPLAAALEGIVRASGKATALRWWSDSESGRR